MKNEAKKDSDWWQMRFQELQVNAAKVVADHDRLQQLLDTAELKEEYTAEKAATLEKSLDDVCTKIAFLRFIATILLFALLFVVVANV